MGEVLHSIDGHVATITLSSVKRHNAMSLSMWQGLSEALRVLDRNLDVRAVVLRGDGEKAFVSGADISEFGEKRDDPAAVELYNAAVAAAQDGLSGFRCPVIAAVSGICYGGGLGLMLACDLRFGAPNATFRMPAARMGLGYGYAGMQRFVSMLGSTLTAEMFYTARVVGALEAASRGLLASVHDDVFAHADKTAREIAANAPMTVEAAKLAIATITSGHATQDDIDQVRRAVDACFNSADYKEGRAAFAEKRTPRFIGR